MSRWIERRFAVDVPIAAIGACIGSKEFVGTLPQWLRLRAPDRDTVLYPATSYPTYEMGAILAGCRPVPVAAAARPAASTWPRSTPPTPSGPSRCGSTARATRRAGSTISAPSPPGVVPTACPVFSDECYVEFTWDGPGRSILEHGLDGVVAVHSLSKRSNLAGGRVGFYAGDPELVHYLQEVRKHVGMMVPGPAQAAGVVALDDDAHVEVQRRRYRHRLERMAEILGAWSGQQIPLPAGGFYLWFPVGDGWAFAERLAAEGGAIVSPGEFYGVGAEDHVRVAVVQPDDRIELVAERLGV